MRFWGLTVSLVAQNHDLFYQEGREQDPTLIPQALLEIASTSEKPDTSARLRIGRISQDEWNLIGLYARRTTARLYDKNFQRHDEPNYPPRIWVWDQVEQTLLVQVDTQIFSDAEVAVRIFTSLLNPILAKNQVEALIYPKISEESFWNVASEFSSISDVTFEYSTPNLFGKTKQEMGEFLSMIRNTTNATSVTTKITNREGNLHPKHGGAIARALDWIKDGGGRWSMKGRVTPKERPVIKSSGKQARVFVLPDDTITLETTGYSASDLTKIISALRSDYSFRRQDLQ
jgi:hypothetical protein